MQSLDQVTIKVFKAKTSGIQGPIKMIKILSLLTCPSPKSNIAWAYFLVLAQSLILTWGDFLILAQSPDKFLEAASKALHRESGADYHILFTLQTHKWYCY